MRKKKQNHAPILHIEIGEMAAEGKCVTRYNDKVIFVEQAAPGDVVDLKIKKSKKNFSVAEIQHIHSLSPNRVNPFCTHYGTCGGCKWQHIDYQTQLFYKTKQVKDNFERIAKVPIPILHPILPANEDRYYRNKLEFTFSSYRWFTKAELDTQDTLNRNALGFHVPDFFDRIIDVEHCYLQQSPSNEIRNALKVYANEQNLSFYDVRNQSGLLRNLIIRTSASTADLMVIVQFGKNDPDNIKMVMDFLATQFTNISSLQYVINEKGNETFHDLDVICYKGANFIEETMDGLKFRIGAKSFFQTNSSQALALYSIARNMASLKGNELVYDLYTGTGTIANFVAKKAKKVIGVEYIADAIKDAKINSQINGIDNTAFFAGDMKDVLTDQFVVENGTPDVIITDPPRAGMHEEVIQMLIRLKATKIVYISCNPATQARDVAMLSSLYDLIELQPVDMFPHTHHVETVALLQIKKS
jgi:23S rRNA (uracil1939-C5)-methyltransferase